MSDLQSVPSPVEDAELERLIGTLMREAIEDGRARFPDGAHVTALTRAAREALRSYLSADTRRLDWLVESGAIVDQSNSSAEDGEPWQCTIIPGFGSTRSTYFWGATAREVIDKARSGMRDSPQDV